ncbi:putative DNA-directed RNA polymerase [Helianthus annuus]|nr:putative DNA-directed RNA polymerase [Helianthus annuus]
MWSMILLQNPSDCFVKAAKSEASDKLEGTIDALSWGKVPALGDWWKIRHFIFRKVDIIYPKLDAYMYYLRTLRTFILLRVKCDFSPCGLGHFASLVQRFHFSLVGPKRFHRCHFSQLG